MTTKKSRKQEYSVAVILLLAGFFFLLGKAYMGDQSPRVRIVPPLESHEGYTLLTIGTYVIDAYQDGNEPKVLYTTDDKIIVLEPGDIGERENGGSVMPGQADFFWHRNCKFYRALQIERDKFPFYMQYKPVDCNTVPGHPVWVKGTMTKEVVDTHLGSAFMPLSRGPADSDADWPDINQPVGQLMLSTFEKTPPGMPVTWHQTGLPCLGPVGTFEVLKGGPLVVYLNYDFDSRASDAMKRGRGVHRNKGGFTITVTVWRPVAPKAVS